MGRQKANGALRRALGQLQECVDLLDLSHESSTSRARLRKQQAVECALCSEVCTSLPAGMQPMTLCWPCKGAAITKQAIRLHRTLVCLATFSDLSRASVPAASSTKVSIRHKPCMYLLLPSRFCSFLQILYLCDPEMLVG